MRLMRSSRGSRKSRVGITCYEPLRKDPRCADLVKRIGIKRAESNAMC